MTRIRERGGKQGAWICFVDGSGASLDARLAFHLREGAYDTDQLIPDR